MSELVPWMAPYSGWTILLALALIGCAIAAFGLFADRARGRKRCPRCGYDLSHSPTATCSECGHALRRDRDAFRTRRRWRVVNIGLLVAIVPPAFVAERRMREFGWRYYTYVGPLYWLLPDVGIDTAVGDATLRVSRDRRDIAWNVSGVTATLRHRGRTLWSTSATDIEIGCEVEPGVITGNVRPIGAACDVDRDGRPECVVECFWRQNEFSDVHVLKIVDDRAVDLVPPTFQRVANADGNGFADLDGNGRLALIGSDPTFEWWHRSIVQLDCPRVVLALRGGKYELAPDVMRHTPVPDAATLRNRRDECRAMHWPTTRQVEGFEYPALLVQTMLDLIYAGRSADAYAFLDDAWPGDAASKEKFIVEFRARLATSPYRDALVALGHPPFDDR